MAIQPDDEFEFEIETDETPVSEARSKPDIEIEDDTPEPDKGRKPMKEPVEEPTEDELASYDEKVQKRLKKFTKGYHDERRAKEEALRERQAAEEFARQMLRGAIARRCHRQAIFLRLCVSH